MIDDNRSSEDPRDGRARCEESRSAAPRVENALPGDRLGQGLSRHERYHAGLDELAEAQVDLLRACLSLASPQAPATVAAALERLSVRIGQKVDAPGQVGRAHAWAASEVLAQLALGCQSDAAAGSLLREAESAAARALAASLPRRAPTAIDVLTGEHRREAAELRDLAARAHGLLTREGLQGAKEGSLEDAPDPSRKDRTR